MKATKKLGVLLIGTALAFQVIGCGDTKTAMDGGRTQANTSVLAAGKARQDSETSQENASVVQNTGEDQQQTDIGNRDTGESDRILIAYFTAGENSDVDVVSSASVTTVDGEAKGRLRAVADMIQVETGGTLFSIQTAEKYPGDGGALIDYAAQEQDEDARPELTSHIENPDDYDIFFIGFPNWWFDMPMAMYSFFEEYDFSGKTIIPFNVHNGSRFSGTIATIQELEPEAKVITDGFTVNERDVADASGDVTDWLRRLGY